ncbi:MAG: glycosyl transferase family 1 [Candidatus Omnitrophica bacterium CG11_big_fil_rev_8_21_14_0_20_63_9]|nr:MAG: glycosyl transferase family 1 [Candidatus Omnitrophica bacterium CG11_big_fil_rev_8_21_14_0_20_63_9]
MPDLAAYEPIAGPSVVSDLRELAKRLAGRRVLMVNSTRLGGGVAEILNRMVPLMREVGVDARWDVIEGTDPFYRVTKKFHNALHGKAEEIPPEMFETFLEVGRSNAQRIDLDVDIAFIHDPQPITLVEQRPKRPAVKWIWRCHIDVSRPIRTVWQFLEPFVKRFDAAIYSSPAFAQRMDMRQVLVAPSIDPLSEKNRELTPEEIDAVLARLGVPKDQPIITQVSRFDYLKDPIGVIEAFKRVRKSVKCRLVLAGGTASDDPEGEEVLAKVREQAKGHPEIHLLMLPADSHLEINALQRASAVVVQKSIREGFGLTVSEALWKARPVVASAVGGIPLQVKHGYSGLLVHTVEGAAHAIKQLLNNPAYAKRLGENGREHVRQNFLLTRHLMDYLLLFLALDYQTETIRLNGV